MPSWPDIPNDQIVSFNTIKQAISEKYLVENNPFPTVIDLNEMCTRENFEYFCLNSVDKALALNQLVPKGAVS